MKYLFMKVQKLSLIPRCLFLVIIRETSCYGGFYKGLCVEGTDQEHSHPLEYWPQISDDKIVDDLATLLTSGRMSKTNRDIISRSYFEEKQRSQKQGALLVASQLAISSPEFHVTGKASPVGASRESSPLPTKTCKRHKTVIHLLLAGGCDSYNMLIPHSKCNGVGKFKYLEKCLHGIIISHC